MRAISGVFVTKPTTVNAGIKLSNYGGIKLSSST